MPNYRQALPQLNGDLFLTDGGIETTLIFHDGLDLPHFAAFDLLKRGEGRDALNRYFRTHASVAKAYGVGFILESATWRASADWAALLGYSKDELAEANRESIALLEEVRREFEDDTTRMVISGCVGPRGDGYNPASQMTPEEAEAYHGEQIATFSRTGAELLFEVFSQRYERGSILVTSNLPFEEWTEIFGSERLTGALLDRLTHHVHILEMNGDSYRLKQSKTKKKKRAA